MRACGINLMWTLNLVVVFFLLTVRVAGTEADSPPRRTWDEVTKPPLDSAEAQRVRVWVPVEAAGVRLVEITVMDDSGRVVSQLLRQVLSKGYYNLFWDKRDDSGRYVEAGIYTYRIKGISPERTGSLEVVYQRWERLSRLYLIEEGRCSRVGFELRSDSALVSITVLNLRGGVIDRPVRDSLLNSGTYEYEWSPPRPGYVGRFVLQLRVGDYIHDMQITCRRNQSGVGKH